MGVILTVSTGNWVDNDDGKKDVRGYGCSAYSWSDCSKYDTYDFKSKIMCHVCGGGLSKSNCGLWPKFDSYSCSDEGNAYTPLNTSMDISQKRSCTSLCEEQGETGCCFLNSNYGCYWKSGSTAIKSYDDNPGIAVSCSDIGTNTVPTNAPIIINSEKNYFIAQPTLNLFEYFNNINFP